MNPSRFLQRCVILLPALLASCSWYSIENGYVFSGADAVESFMPAPLNCQHITRYHKDEDPGYFALYQPEPDIRAYLSLRPSVDRDILAVGPGVAVPLPVIPTVSGEVEAVTHTRKGTVKAISPFRLAIYPYPHKRGYQFDPSLVQIRVGEEWLSPSSARYYTTHNRVLKPEEQVRSRASLPAHSQEYQMYLLEFATTRKSGPVEELKVSGFSKGDVMRDPVSYPLATNKAGRFDWKMDRCKTR